MPPEATFLALAEWAYRNKIVDASKRKHTMFGVDGSCFSLIPHDEEIVVVHEINQFAVATAREQVERVVARLDRAEHDLDLLTHEDIDRDQIAKAQEKVVAIAAELEALNASIGEAKTVEYRLNGDLSNLTIQVSTRAAV